MLYTPFEKFIACRICHPASQFLKNARRNFTKWKGIITKNRGACNTIMKHKQNQAQQPSLSNVTNTSFMMVCC